MIRFKPDDTASQIYFMAKQLADFISGIGKIDDARLKAVEWLEEDSRNTTDGLTVISYNCMITFLKG